MRILVVEDDANLNRQLTDALKEAGYVVDQAFDGEEGHYLGDTEPYDAIVLDIGLPQLDGITVVEKWRAAGKAMCAHVDRTDSPDVAWLRGLGVSVFVVSSDQGLMRRAASQAIADFRRG